MDNKILSNVDLLLMFSCRRLYLNDNMISDVGRGTFSSINRIGTIDLARNQIKKVDYQMFAQLNYVEVCYFTIQFILYDRTTL